MRRWRAPADSDETILPRLRHDLPLPAEWVIDLIVAPSPDDLGGAGVTADLPNDPRPLVAGAEAEPPADPDIT